MGPRKTKDKRQKTKDKGWGGDLCLLPFVFCLPSFVFLGTEPSTKFDSALSRQYPGATCR
jgi:hypothetical protein